MAKSPNMKYFKLVGKQYVFTGNSLEIFVNRKFEAAGFLWMGETVKTIGVFDMLINGSIESGLMLPSVVEIVPDEISDVNIGGQEFVKLTLEKGSVFLTDNTYVEYGNIAEILFGEFNMRGRYPKFIEYEDTGFIWESIGSVTGVHYATSQSIFEMMAAYSARDKDDISIQYRHTSRKKPPKYIGYFDVTNLAESMSGRLNGAYAREGLNACLANASDTVSPMEEVLRT